MIDTKISDLKELKKELRKHLMRRQHEFRCYLNAHEDLFPDTELLGEEVKQSLRYWTAIASKNRLAEVNALKNTIKKINEQIKKQAVEK